MDGNGVMAALFDFSFSKFVTTKILKFLYGMSLFLAGVITFLMIVGGFMHGVLTGILGLCLAPVVFLIQVMVARIWLECVAVVFNIAENIQEIARKG